MTAVDITEVRSLLAGVIDDEARIERLSAGSPLLGAVPELDSIAAVNLLLAIEERFGVEIDDDEVEESIFATLGALHAFVASKAEHAATTTFARSG